MNRGIFGQAEKRLGAARKKAAEIKNSRSLDEITELWSEFLTEHSRFFNRLGNAMEAASEKGWFDRALAARKTDKTMSYLMHARNADEHGHLTITKIQPNGIALGTPKGFLHIEKMTFDAKGHIKELRGWDGAPGRKIPVLFVPGEVMAINVMDRGQSYQPPEGISSVPVLATVAVDYLESVLAAARTL
ncbi:hypothetical protein [Sphingomonas faeni]|uniref:hypothetical protein n=1 Tax=Sphingomonas faeni TaxID=185950 RepID=UPI0027D7FE08|nr:hypothetical protein [Sphingomonas faeni]